MKPIILAAWEMLLKTNKKMFKKKGNSYLRDKWDNYSLAGTLCELHSYIPGEGWKLGPSGKRYFYIANTSLVPSQVIRWAFEWGGKELTPEENLKLQAFVNDFSDLYIPNLRWPTNKEFYQAFGGDYEKLKRKRYVEKGNKK